MFEDSFLYQRDNQRRRSVPESGGGTSYRIKAESVCVEGHRKGPERGGKLQEMTGKWGDTS